MRRTLLVSTLALALSSGAFAQDTGHSGMDHGGSTGGTASTAYMDAMKTMNRSMSDMAMTGKPGVDFAEMMVPHHQSAIDMAKAYLASGENDPTLTKLANDVVSSQQGEIAELKRWLGENAAK